MCAGALDGPTRLCRGVHGDRHGDPKWMDIKKTSKVMSYPENELSRKKITMTHGDLLYLFQKNWDLTRKNNVFYHVLSNLSSKHGDF